MVTSKCTQSAAGLAGGVDPRCVHMAPRKCTHLARLLAAALALVSTGGGVSAAWAAPAPAPAPSDSPHDDAPTDAPEPPAAPSGGSSPAQKAPQIHHMPLTSVKEGERVELTATIDEPQLVKSAIVVYRTGDKWFSVRLLRSADGYAAVIPAEHVKAPSLAYAIELTRADGGSEHVFATRASPQEVIVHEDTTDTRERWLLDRLDGRRSLVAVTGELVRFGPTQGKSALPCAAGQDGCKPGELRVPEVDDQYWRVEGSYTYRPLRTVAEFGFRLGVVRGRSVVDVLEYDDDKFDVGLNYAGASVRFRLADIFHTELSTIGSVTEVGFSVGGGAAMIFGDPYGFKLTLGAEAIGVTKATYFGTRLYTRLDLPVTSRITVAPSVEVTDMPHADRFGVRLLADAGFVLGKGFSLWLRGGYQARISKSGGPAGGATVQYGF
ncbi:MAG: hypothetical protein R3B70_15920 [Polyangiaceae bacterium]